jgi:hypothetical protein
MSVTVLGAQKVNNSNVTLCESVQVTHPGRVLVLDRAAVAEMVGQAAANVYGVDIRFDCEDAMLRVVGIPHVALRAFANTTPHFSRLLVAEAESGATLDGLTVGELEVELTHWQLVDASVDRVNVGIRTARRQGAEPEPMRSTVSGSRVGLLRVFVRQESLRITRGVVSHLLLEPPPAPQGAAMECAELRVTAGSAVERLSVSGTVTRLVLQDATIDDLRIRGTARVNHLDASGSSIARAYNCRPGTFPNPNLDTWALVQ